MRKVTRYSDHELQWEVPWPVVLLELAGHPQHDPDIDGAD